VDVDYAEFLQRFGEIGMKAIANDHDMQVYEAIRALSIAKECPASTEQDIARAQQHLQRVSAAEGKPSEASLLARLHWWTVEYGLVGELDDYRIFGAGLLSSLGESVHALDDEKVLKRPLTVDAVTSNYDITSLQTQLFVTKSCKHLSQVLEEFASSMCFVRGGAESLRMAIEAGTICTAQYESGMQVSGVFSEVLCDAVGNAIYLRTQGPTGLAWRDTEVFGQGTTHHPGGFGSPIGLLKDFSRCLSDYTFDELKAHNISLGETVRLEFLSGVTVCGHLQGIHRQEHRNLILSFSDCTVTDLNGRLLFEPSWGCYDMVVGSAVESVFGGSADRNAFRLYQVSSGVQKAPEAPDVQLMSLYSDIASKAVDNNSADTAWLARINAGLDVYCDEWLLRAEILELPGPFRDSCAALLARCASELREICHRKPDLESLIARVLDDSHLAP
ncbi:MAG: aromatic amino acid hydroxylase, partial [Halioglobus sp.]